MSKISLYKKLNKKEGFISIYVLLLGTVITTIALFMFSIELSYKKYNLYTKSYVTKSDIRSDNTQYILGKINFIINNQIKNESGLEIENIKQYFKHNPELIYHESYFKYDEINDESCFQIVTKLSNNYIFKDIYKINVKDNKCYFEYMYTE